MRDIEYNLKNDVFFKEFFTRNVDFTKNFLESVLNKKIEKLQIMKDVTLNRDSIDDKLGVLDLKAILDDDRIIDIEMQLNDYQNWKKRATFYASKLVTGQCHKKDAYINMKRVIVISILDFNITDFPEYCEESVIVVDKHREYEVMDTVKFYFIQLPKYRKANKIDNQLEYWLTFIDYKDERGIEMIKKKEKLFVEAEKELKYLTGDEELRRLAELREKAVMDEQAAYVCGVEQGKEQGIKQGMEKGREQGIEQGIKQGMEKGREQGIEQGIKQGIKQGAEESKLEIAKSMKEKKCEIDLIIDVTGLTREQIEKL